MKDFISKYWTPVTGAMSSISFKGISDMTTSPVAEETIHQATSHQPALITYLWIGVLGALGGLMVKVIWGLLKHAFPSLKNIDR